MRTFILVAAICAVFAATASAEDAAGPNWTGCYANTGVGYGTWNLSHNLVLNDATLSQSNNSGGEGPLIKVGGGCDYQWKRWVIGGLFDYDWMDLSGRLETSDTEGVAKENAAWAFGARAGYLTAPSFLLYVNGGYTRTRFGGIVLSIDSLIPIGIPPTLARHTYDGFFIGGGAEYALLWSNIQGLFWRTEFRFSRYFADNVPFTNANSLVAHTELNVQTIATGLVWKFNLSSR